MSNTMNTKIIGMVAAAIAVAAGGFFGGIQYQKKTTTEARAAFRGQTRPGVGRFGQFGSGRAPGGGAVAGEIISRDDKTLTVKLRDGGSKIVLLSDSTDVRKTTAGTRDDLTVGTSVVIAGSANADGSIAAQSVQIRPNLPTPPAP